MHRSVHELVTADYQGPYAIAELAACDSIAGNAPYKLLKDSTRSIGEAGLHKTVPIQEE